MIEAVLFDIDGTLLDSNDFHVMAWIEVFHRAGFEFDPQVIHDQIGKGTDMLVPTLFPDADEAMQHDFGKAHGEVFKSKFLSQVRPFPHARDLLVRVHKAGQQVVLASSASQAEIDYYVDLLDVRSIVAATTTADEVEHTKPSPDIFATALGKLAPLGAKQAIVVGDTPYDMEAAAKCDIRAIGVRSGKFSDEVLLGAGAAALYDDVAGLLADYANSPLAQAR